MRNRCRLRITLISLALAAMSGSTHSEDRAAEREQERSRRLQQRMQQMQKSWEEEKRALEAKLKAAEERAKTAAGPGRSTNVQIARLKKELKAERDRNTELTRDVADRAGEKEILEARLARAEKSFSETQKTLDEAAARLRDNEGQLRLAQDQRKDREATIVAREQDMKACEAKNAQLYTYGNELLEKYRKQGLFDRLLRSEPVFQLKQVQVENLIEEYRDKLDAQKIEHAGR